ncbi:ribonuclease III [Candidatus Uhrbacteria bacterium RIFCSPHIGHO2_02_FULL_53_13]|uniref:Ribonuclease 3 n=2 Tax=Candidatus Uhriibacteriota TaxID=1752732 RepID=A0A1F7TYD4_9BACT|nr:MAG: ribonuclease III [Candidatus Uhrbacteria bacterium RIFCSPHIGHO2_02_FULL_53_13]OGL90392.1 MAG: ribonuclease III [Candidatus Uhrbacteria bacterium RIFCSPLOWO2_02_FULL_53_10]
MEKDLSNMEKALGVTFQNIDTLRQALVHRSYLNEHTSFPLDHNERLEFLGDAVLELVVTEYLYLNYPNPEGEMTNWRAALVNGQQLANIAAKLFVEDFLYMSRGERKDRDSKARRYILANAMEAIIGAMYLDRGWDVAKEFVTRAVLSLLPEILEKKLYIDPKSRFQESAQEHTGITPTYRVHSEEGPDHEKVFTVGVYLEKERVAEGVGTSKQEAQVDAAEKAIEAKGW